MNTTRQEAVAEIIGRSIIAGRYPVGAVLPREDDLSLEHGVSRTTVRGAMAALAAKGLVDIRRRTGTTVRPRDDWDVFDSDLLRWAQAEGRDAELTSALRELRRVLEPEAAGLAAERASLAQLAALETAVQALVSAAESRDDDAYAGADLEFHRLVYAASGNPMLVRFGTIVADVLRIVFTIQQQRPHAVDLASDAARHADVFDAVRDRDRDRAVAAMLDTVLDGTDHLHQREAR